MSGHRQDGHPATRKRWADFTRAQRVAIVAAGAAEIVLTAAALRDLARRPAGRVRGPKPMWVLGCLVQPVGPIAYLLVGRRGDKGASADAPP